MKINVKIHSIYEIECNKKHDIISIYSNKVNNNFVWGKDKLINALFKRNNQY